MFFFVTHMEEMFEDVLRVANRPMPILAAALFAGLGLGYLQSLLATLVLLVLFAGLAVRCIGTSETRKFWTLSAIGVAAGFLLAARDVTLREREARLFGENGVDGEFVCRVSEPVLERRVKNGGTRYSFKAESFAAVDGGLTIRRLPVQMTMTFNAGADGPQAGERWRFRGSARAEQAPKSPLPEVDVAVGMDGGARRIERATDNPTWLMRIEQWRRRAAERAVLGIEDWGTIPELNQAILLGVRGEMPLAMRRIFANSGTIHIFAISGLHIMLIASILILLISIVGVPMRFWVLPLAPMLVFYTIVTGARPSAVRACVMAILYFAAPMFWRKPDSISVLCVTAIAVHVWQPSLIFDVGCRLSFVVMAGVVFLCPPILAILRKFLRIEQLMVWERLFRAAGSRRKEKAVRLWRHALIWLSGSVAVSLSAWLASVPLTAQYFGRLTPGALLANLVIVPASFFVVTGGCLGMAASFVSTFAAECFNNSAGAFTWIMIKAAEWTAAWPQGSFKITRWYNWEAGLWYAGLILAAFYLHARYRLEPEFDDE
jgi:ComEC/Rec2-related protein